MAGEARPAKLPWIALWRLRRILERLGFKTPLEHLSGGDRSFELWKKLVWALVRMAQYEYGSRKTSTGSRLPARSLEKFFKTHDHH